MHVYRWDLDRTYLDTDIHSVRGLLRTAMETATDKRTIPGADALLRGLLDHDPEARATILSGSPVQLRAVLAEKLDRDGIRYDSLVLKDNLRNLRRGRFRAVRGQLGYKLPQLLRQRAEEPPETTESLFGDDAEVDALVYALYADAVAGRADADEVAAVMRAGGAYDDQVSTALTALARLVRADAVDGIYIHVDRGLPLAAFRRLGPAVHVVFSWFQAALVLHERGRLDGRGVAEVGRRVGRSSRDLAALAQDAVRRGLATSAGVRALVDEEPELAEHREAIGRALDLLGGSVPRDPASDRDYLGFLAASTRAD